MGSGGRRRGAGVGLALGACLLARSVQASAGADANEEAERRLQAARSPRATALMEQGEGRVAAGDLAGAATLFQEGVREDRDSPLLPRRACEVLTALGRAEEARTACFAALQVSKSNANTRATVRSLVSDPAGLTAEQLGLALVVIARQKGRSPDEFTPAAAMCDIAERLGDGIMLERCANDLVRVSPESDEARIAVARLDAFCPPWRVWAGWLVIALSTLGTLAHAACRSLRGQAAAGVALGVLALLSGAPRVAAASEEATAEPPTATPAGGWLSKWKVDDEHPTEHIPTEQERDQDPLEFGYWLQDLALKAEIAVKRGDHPAAARYYAALAKAVPDRAIGWARLCDELEAAGDVEKAEAACGAALLRDGLQVKDYQHYAHLVLVRPGALDDARVKALDGVIDHLREAPAGHEAAIDLGCEVGAKTGSVARLEACTEALAARSPADPKAVVYRWTLAMQRGDLEQASALLREAGGAGLDSAGLLQMDRAVAARASFARRRQVLVGVAAALGAGALVVLWRRRRGVLGALVA